MSGLVNVILTIFWGLLLLSILVFIHEGGHFLAARAFGMRVTEFFIGLPSKARLSFKSKSLGTEFGVSPILLGGYTMICGMDGTHDELLAPALALVTERGVVSLDEACEILGCDAERADKVFSTLADWASVMCVVPEGEQDGPISYQSVARDANLLTQYDKGNDFSAPGATSGGTPRDIDMTPEEYLDKERSHTYVGHGFLHRVCVLLAGPLVNIIFAVIIYVILFSCLGVDYYVNINRVGDVAQDSMAEQAGISPGDTILSIDGVETNDWNDIVDALDAVLPTGEDFEVVIDHEGTVSTVLVDQDEANPSDVLGITVYKERTRLSVVDSIKGAFSYAGQVAAFAIRLITPTHTAEVLQSTSSVVGISIMTREAVQNGLRDLILIFVAVSMSLGFMNLLPIPPLDGGKILIEVIQLVIRRPLPQKAQLIVSYIGLALFLIIFVMALKNDIVNFILG